MFNSKLRPAEFLKYDVVSTDLFDTLLLRDLSLEPHRFDEAARKAAQQLGTHPARLSALRRAFHTTAYKAVAAERPLGDASLQVICNTVALAIGRGADAAKVLHDIEIEVDIMHLAPNRKMLELYQQLSDAGKRVIAITDTYYSQTAVQYIVEKVVGPTPIAQIYASCDFGLTKHSGALFAETARREGVSTDKMIHIGDDLRADVVQARANGLDAMYLPRSTNWRRIGKIAVGLFGRRGGVNFQA